MARLVIGVDVGGTFTDSLLLDTGSSSFRVAVSEDLSFAQVDDGIRTTFRDRVDRFRSAFKTCDERDPDLAGADDIFWILRGIHLVAAHK